MAIQIQLRQGTTTEHDTFTGAVGEVTVDTTKDTLVVHDGVTVGGHPVAARANADGTISLIKKDGTSAGTINADGLFNNTLTSTNTNQALTAAQGKVLKDLADTKLAATSAFGVGQTWVDVTSERVANTSYLNPSSRPIQVAIQSSSAGDFQVSTDGVNWVWAGYVGASGDAECVFPSVPAGHRYRLTSAFQKWSELK